MSDPITPHTPDDPNASPVQEGGSNGFDDQPQSTTTEEALVVDVDGFEGPLDLLLGLARDQKVDLVRISILRLAEQYLVFIDTVRQHRLEVAADYLVMAAWLAYLKSCLLLPEEETAEDEPSGQELAAVLRFRLRRLEAMRSAANRLMSGHLLGRDVFARGDPEPVKVRRGHSFDTTLFDLLSAYAAQRRRNAVSTVHLKRRTVWSQAEARDILLRLVGEAADWTPMSVFLSAYLSTTNRQTVLASSFSASLELAREGLIKLRQSGTYQPLYMRGASATEREVLNQERAPFGPDTRPETDPPETEHEE